MKILSALAFALLLLFSSCGGDEYPKTLLWKIEGNGLEEPSYLFGTIHVTCDATLSNKIKSALEKTEVLVLEIAPEELWPEDAEYTEDYAVILPNGNTLHDYMTEEEYRTVRTYMMRLGDFDLDDYNTYHPIGLSLYQVPPELNCGGYFDSFESSLADKAYENYMDFGGLETLAFQTELLQNTPVEPHIRYLLREAKSEKPASNNAIRLIQIHYKNEDLNGIQRVTLSDKYTKTWRSNPQILDQRNLNWIPKMDSMVHARPTFFGVGAAHLVGSNGLIRLMEAQGYTMTPVF